MVADKNYGCKIELLNHQNSKLKMKIMRVVTLFIFSAIFFSCKLMPKEEEKENIKPMTDKNFIWMIGD